MYNRDKWIFVATVTPGIYTWLEILNQFYQDSKNNINVEKYSTNKYKYIGSFSNTKMEIRLIAGKNFVKHHICNPNSQDEWIKNIQNQKIRNIRRLTHLKIIELYVDPNYEEKIKQSIIELWWLIYTVLTITLCIIIGLMEDWFAFSIITNHIICNFMIHVLLLNGNIFGHMLNLLKIQQMEMYLWK